MPCPAPFRSSLHRVEEGWIDYNGHMNMGYYTGGFDRASDELWDWIGFGERYVAETNHTTFAAEFHVRYLREVQLGDRLSTRRPSGETHDPTCSCICARDI